MSWAPVPILQHDGELRALLELYRARAPRSILEVGVWRGGTLWHWLAYARQDVPVLVVALDRELAERERFQGWAPDNVQLELLEAPSGSPAAAERVRALAPAYDWVFIDADHAYGAVKADWELYGRLGRVVVFHDIHVDPALHPEIGVPQLWAELAGEHEHLELVDEARERGWGGFGVLFR